VKVPAPGQTVLDEITTRDDLGNEYCVTLYQNVTATYHPGTCGSPISGAGAAAEPTATTVDLSAFPLGLACIIGTPVVACNAAYSDGSTRKLEFVQEIPANFKKLDSDPHTDDKGVLYCVTIYGFEEDAKATYVAGSEGC
jgi:hypothetical protein